jgi:hypothetical protein
VTLRVTPVGHEVFFTVPKGVRFMKLALFPAGRFDALVQRVAERVTARCPPVIANNPERTVSEERIEEILEESIAGALQLPLENRMGFLARTRLKSALKWELREIGYEEKFADRAAEKLIEQMLRSPA